MRPISRNNRSVPPASCLSTPRGACRPTAFRALEGRLPPANPRGVLAPAGRAAPVPRRL